MTKAIQTGRFVLRLSLALILIATVAVLLVATQLRPFVPDRKPARFRDLIGLTHGGR